VRGWRIPIVGVLGHCRRGLVLDLLATTATFLVFCVPTVFALNQGMSPLAYLRQELLGCNGANIVGASVAPHAANLLPCERGSRAQVTVMGSFRVDANDSHYYIASPARSGVAQPWLSRAESLAYV
jgi:hypothetical protein